MLGPAHSLTGSSPGSRPDVSNPRTRSRTCASSNTFPLEPAIDAARTGHRIGSPSVGDARGVVKEVSDRTRPEVVGIYAGRIEGLGGRAGWSGWPASSYRWLGPCCVGR